MVSDSEPEKEAEIFCEMVGMRSVVLSVVVELSLAVVFPSVVVEFSLVALTTVRTCTYIHM